MNPFTWVKWQCKNSGCIVYGSEIHRRNLHFQWIWWGRDVTCSSALVLKLKSQLHSSSQLYSVMLGLQFLSVHFSFACRLLFFSFFFLWYSRKNNILFFLFLNFTILYWFCQISKWICHRYIFLKCESRVWFNNQSANVFGEPALLSWNEKMLKKVKFIITFTVRSMLR